MQSRVSAFGPDLLLRYLQADPAPVALAQLPQPSGPPRAVPASRVAPPRSWSAPPRSELGRLRTRARETSASSIAAAVKGDRPQQGRAVLAGEQAGGRFGDRRGVERRPVIRGIAGQLRRWASGRPGHPGLRSRDIRDRVGDDVSRGSRGMCTAWSRSLAPVGSIVTSSTSVRSSSGSTGEAADRSAAICTAVGNCRAVGSG